LKKNVFEKPECNLFFAEVDDDEKVPCIPIKKEFEIHRPDETCTYFTINTNLKTGYNYLFILHINDNEEDERKFISDTFPFSGKLHVCKCNQGYWL